MALRTFEPNEEKELTLEIKVKVKCVGNSPCVATADSTRDTYHFMNGTGHIDHQIKEHLQNELKKDHFVESDIFDHFYIEVM